ncbi:MAG: iron-sulfur cluster assembly accessory protein [Methylococcaceae bacterium]|nr:MAG: iron-sulfur cluster assembly accessory protein [Methylococcaceae bacterium]
MSIQLTESAARQIDKQLKKRGKGIGLRLGVRQSGCSGYAYLLDYADEIAAGEQIFEQHGVKVLVRDDDLPVLNGIQLDYTREGISEAFRFHNPNVKATCGCGESFAV